MKRQITMGSSLLLMVLCLFLASAGQGWSKDRKNILKQTQKGVSAVTAEKAEGKKEIRILSEGIDFEAKGSAGEEDRIETVPVVLWGKTEPVAVLSMHYGFELKGEAKETYTFRKHSLDGKAKTFKEKIQSAADDYPISYRIKMKDLMDKEEYRDLDAIEPRYVLTADVNGDGVEELIIPRRHGSMAVYSIKKRLFHSPPWDGVGPAKAFTLLSVRSHLAVFEDRDVVLYAYNRRLSDELTPAQRKVLPQDRVSAIFQIDHKGIRQIVPYGVNWMLRDIRAIGALNYPGSKEIDEILVLHELEQDQGKNIYLTRLKPDGQVIGKPRKFYQSYTESGNTKFHFVPQSSQAIMEGAEGFYFITPEKPANWARQVNMPDQYAGILRGDKGLIVLVRSQMDIFAFDEECRFYTRDGYGRFQRGQGKKMPAYTITVESGLHRIKDFVLNKQAAGKPEYLIVQDREPQMKSEDLTWDKDYWPAAQKFMKDAWIQELREESQWYLTTARDVAEEEYLAKHGKKRSLPALSDVKEHFPEYYEQFMKNAESKFRGSVISALTQPLGGTKSIKRYFDSKTNFEHHKDFEGFRKWCEPLFIPDELVFSLVADFKTLMKIRVPDFNQSHGRPIDLKLNMPLTGYRRHANILNIVSVGQFKGALDTYLTDWLYIHHEGVIR